jgi:hypothetical protein
MQNSVLKILITLLALSILVYGKAQPAELYQADSLFQQKRYTQSFELYRSVFDKHHYSPAMLLKMAYIEEALDHVASAAYYINLYFLLTHDSAALTKLEELARKNNLEGYQSSDSDRVYIFYQEYHQKISIGLATLALFAFITFIVQRVRSSQKKWITWSFTCILAALLLIHINWGGMRKQAIVAQNNTYLMDAPSAGASVVSIVRDGHRVSITGKKDVWVKVKWGEQDVYIKQANLLPVKL